MTDIKDGWYGFLGGTVSKVYAGGDHPRIVVEFFERENDKYPKRVTVWGSFGVMEGDRVKFKGWNRADLRDYTKDDGTQAKTVSRALSGAELVEHAAGAANGFDPSRAGFVEIDETPF